MLMLALVAGGLALGTATAQDKADLDDAQKARLAELNARLETLRTSHDGRCDSLADGMREGIRDRSGASRGAWGALSEERKALREDIKALMEEYKEKLAADGADREALAAEMQEKIKALTGAFRAEHKATIDSLKAARKADWENRLADGKARFGKVRREIDGGGRGPLTPEQIEELKKRLEETEPAP
jgi:hypothetical protein